MILTQIAKFFFMLFDFFLFHVLFDTCSFVGNIDCRPVRPGKDANQPRAENDDTLEIGNADSPRRREVINDAGFGKISFFYLQSSTDERSQGGADILLEEVEDDDAAADEVEEVPDVEAAETPSAAAAADPGPGGVAVAKAVRRLSFSSGSGGNEPKKLKTSGGRAKEQRKVLKKKPVSKTKKAGLVLSVSRVHNRLREDRYANRVRFFSL